jgi:L-lactate utilization protein LutC
MDRESFLARVREAARAGHAYRVHTEVLPEGVGYCGAGDDPPARLVSEVNAVGVAELLASRGTEKLDFSDLHDRQPEQRLADMLAAEIGISSASLAVAETGTLALASGPGTERVVSLLPPVHVALVAESQIVPDLFDLFAKMQPDKMPSNWVFITGPSKTGDLELKLTTGVHGPAHWHVIVIRG